MPDTGTIEFWWPLLIGTVIALSLVVALIGLALRQQRLKLHAKSERLALIEESERKYSDLFHNVSDIVYVHSLDGVILQINAAVTRLLGIGSSQIIGCRISDFLRPRYRAALQTYLSAWSHNGLTESSGIVPVRSESDGTIRVIEFRSSVIARGEGPVVIRGVARDVTDRIAHERDMKRNERRTRILLKESQIMQEGLAQLSRDILTVQEEERRSMSRVLHDDVGQNLATVLVDLEIILKSVPRDEPGRRERIIEAQALTTEVISCIRSFLRDLRPEALDQIGVLPCIRQFALSFSKRTGIDVFVEEDNAVESLDGKQKLALYRIVQESLTNSAKHANAHEVTIDFSTEKRNVLVRISDDGDGFGSGEKSADRTVPAMHVGLLSMRERVKIAGGEFTVGSGRPKGTVISVRLPMPEKAVIDPGLT